MRFLIALALVAAIATPTLAACPQVFNDCPANQTTAGKNAEDKA